MFGSAQPESPFSPRREAAAEAESTIADSPFSNGDHVFEGHELDAALQLLVERAQYITGATGAALALSQGDEMVCRASVGSPGPAVGARLQVRSGLSGESISRKQLLRCDNAETDPRVNLETCRQLGIASIVVLPLLTRSGGVRDAFEERDLIALERMAELTLTALDLAERRPRTVPVTPPVPVAAPDPAPSVTAPEIIETSVKQAEGTPADLADRAPNEPEEPAILIPERPLDPVQVHSALFQEPVLAPTLPAVPEAMRRVQKCASCGFPVSEGRTLCVDCENKRYDRAETAEGAPAEFVPAFLAYSPPPDESWLANHVNLLAVLVLILSIVVAVVVFR